jgi:hypothetical protein
MAFLKLLLVLLLAGILSQHHFICQQVGDPDVNLL